MEGVKSYEKSWCIQEIGSSSVLEEKRFSYRKYQGLKLQSKDWSALNDATEAETQRVAFVILREEFLHELICILKIQPWSRDGNYFTLGQDSCIFHSYFASVVPERTSYEQEMLFVLPIDSFTRHFLRNYYVIF